MAFVAPETDKRVRRQLTLFLAGEMAAAVEAVRRTVDPVQYRLIPAHVTLCREEEVAALPEGEIEARLAAGSARRITLEFGSPEHFFDHGIRLKCVAGGAEYQRLREIVLGSTEIARPRPHITLAHPRNPRAPGNSLEFAQTLPPRWPARLAWIHLIEQDGAQPWRRLAMFDLLA